MCIWLFLLIMLFPAIAQSSLCLHWALCYYFFVPDQCKSRAYLLLYSTKCLAPLSICVCVCVCVCVYLIALLTSWRITRRGCMTSYPTFCYPAGSFLSFCSYFLSFHPLLKNLNLFLFSWRILFCSKLKSLFLDPRHL